MQALAYDCIIEDLGHNVVIEWLYGRRIFAFRQMGNSRYSPNDVADLWADSIINIMHNWQSDRPYLCLNDATQFSFTPYVMQRIREVVAATPPQLIGRSVAVLPRSPRTPFVRLYTSRLMRQQCPRIDYRTFSTYDGALDCLVAELRWGKWQAKFQAAHTA